MLKMICPRHIGANTLLQHWQPRNSTCIALKGNNFMPGEVAWVRSSENSTWTALAIRVSLTNTTIIIEADRKKNNITFFHIWHETHVSPPSPSLLDWTYTCTEFRTVCVGTLVYSVHTLKYTSEAMPTWFNWPVDIGSRGSWFRIFYDSLSLKK